MSTYTIQTTWATGTTMTAAALNADPIAIKAALNNIDRTNMGTAGIDATSIIPGTVAAATFGGTVGYTFPSTLASGAYTCSLNTSALPAGPTGTVATFANADSTHTLVVIDNFGVSSPGVVFRLAAGTAASPTAVINGATLGRVAVTGRVSASAYSNGAYNAISFLAEEAWTSTATGFGISFATNATGTTGSAEALRLTNAGHGNFAQTVNVTTAATGNAIATGVTYGGTTATSATTGANGAVPAQVVGYLIITVAGTARKVPFYAT